MNALVEVLRAVILAGTMALLVFATWVGIGLAVTFWMGEHLSSLRLPQGERWKGSLSSEYVSIVPAWMHRWPITSVFCWPVTSLMILISHVRAGDTLTSATTILPTDIMLTGFELPLSDSDEDAARGYRLPAGVPTSQHPRTRWLVDNLQEGLNCAAAVLIFALRRKPGLSRWEGVSIAWIATTDDPFVAFYRKHAAFEALVTEGIAKWSPHGELAFTKKGLDLLEQYRFPDHYIARHRRPVPS